MTKLIGTIAYLIIQLLLISQMAYGQQNEVNKVFEFTETIESTYLNETRTLIVHVPKSYYETKDATYPVLYVLDGNYHHDNTLFIHNFLSGKKHIPEAILVFIPNTGQRKRDYNTFFRDTEIVNEGANHFLSFIEKEAIPQIENKYRNSNYRMLSGHSNGGLFVIHSLIKRPDLFKARFAFSASSHHIPKQRQILRKFLKDNQNLNGYFYMNVGGSEFYKQTDAFAEVKEIFEENAAKGLRYDFDFHDVDGHQSSPFIGQHMAFKRLYAPLRLNQGAYEKMSYDEVVTHFDNISNEFGYEIKPRESELINMGNYFVNYEPNLTVVDNLVALSKVYYPESNEIEGNFLFYQQWLAHGVKSEFKYSEQLRPDENVLNSMGYKYLLKNQFTEALYLLKLATELYPENSNPYDSYGEGLEQTGELKTALEMYKKAHEIAITQEEETIVVYQKNIDRVKEKLKTD